MGFISGYGKVNTNKDILDSTNSEITKVMEMDQRNGKQEHTYTSRRNCPVSHRRTAMNCIHYYLLDIHPPM